MKKYIVRAVSAMLAIVLLSGCGQGAANGQITLQTASMFGEGDSGAQAYADSIQGFRQANPGVLVEDQSEISTEAWKQGVLDRFQTAETTPDVLFFFTGADVRQMILNDQLVSVEEIRTVYPEYAVQIRDSTMRFMREFDGNHYAVPVRGFWEGLFCNQDLFEQYQIPLPHDWDSLLNAVRVFSEKGVTPIAASLTEVPHYWIEHLILSEGGAVEHRLNPKDYVPESWVAGIDHFRTLYELNAFSPNALTDTNAAQTELFLQKKAAMILDGSWLMQSITDAEHTVVLPFPVAPGGKLEQGDIISGFTSGYYISRVAWDDPQKREAAVSFVSYMTSAQSIAALCAKGGAPAMDIPRQQEDSALQRSADALQQNASNACMPIDSKIYKDAWKYLCGEIPDVALGKTTARDVIAQLSKLNQW